MEDILRSKSYGQANLTQLTYMKNLIMAKIMEKNLLYSHKTKGV